MRNLNTEELKLVYGGGGTCSYPGGSKNGTKNGTKNSTKNGTKYGSKHGTKNGTKCTV
jgi:hypothetical protein